MRFITFFLEQKIKNMSLTFLLQNAFLQHILVSFGHSNIQIYLLSQWLIEIWNFWLKLLISKVSYLFSEKASQIYLRAVYTLENKTSNILLIVLIACYMRIVMQNVYYYKVKRFYTSFWSSSRFLCKWLSTRLKEKIH